MTIDHDMYLTSPVSDAVVSFLYKSHCVGNGVGYFLLTFCVPTPTSFHINVMYCMNSASLIDCS